MGSRAWRVSVRRRCCRLTAEQRDRLTAWITEALPRTSREIGAWIAREYGLEYEGRSGLIALLHRLGMEHRKPTAISRKLDPAKQAAFIRSYEALLNQLPADEAVMFADAVHPTHAVRAVGCWAPKDIPVAVTQSSGRERLNIHGAIDLETGNTRMLDVLMVDAASTIMLLMAIEAMYPGGADNDDDRAYDQKGGPGRDGERQHRGDSLDTATDGSRYSSANIYGFTPLLTGVVVGIIRSFASAWRPRSEAGARSGSCRRPDTGTFATDAQLMPSSNSTSALARRAKRCAAEPSRVSSIRSCRDSLSRKPGRITRSAESRSHPLASDSFGFPQSRGYMISPQAAGCASQRQQQARSRGEAERAARRLHQTMQLLTEKFLGLHRQNVGERGHLPLDLARVKD